MQLSSGQANPETKMSVHPLTTKLEDCNRENGFQCGNLEGKDKILEIKEV